MERVLMLAGDAVEDLETASDIEAAGGEFVDGPDVVDRNLVSCRGWGDLAEWSKAFVAALERAAVPV